METKKLLKVANVRKRMDAFFRGEISYTKAVELLNEDANKALNIASVGKRFWLTDKFNVELLCERCDTPTTKVVIEHQKIVSEKDVECDCGDYHFEDDDGY